MPIACVHIPRFAVEVERQRRQGLATRLILIGEATVLDCSLGAETSGVQRGQRMSEALALCHRADVLPPDPPHYQQRFDDVLDVLEGFSPEVESREPGSAFLSLEEAEGAGGVAAAVRRRCGFLAAVGVAGGKFTAGVAALVTRPGLVKAVPHGEEAAFLAPLPIDHLPAGEPFLWRARLLGLETMGDIVPLPLGAFQQQFGPEGKRCWELASGIDREPLSPRLKEESIVRRLEMPALSASLAAILVGLERLVHSAYGDGGRKGRWVRKAVVRGSLDGGGAWELPVAFREALSEPRDAWFAVKCAVERHPPERPVEGLAVELVGLSGESGKQATMFDGRGRLWEQIEESVRQFRAQGSEAPIGRVVEVEPWSRIPERRTAIVDLDP